MPPEQPVQPLPETPKVGSKKFIYIGVVLLFLLTVTSAAAFYVWSADIVSKDVLPVIDKAQSAGALPVALPWKENANDWYSFEETKGLANINSHYFSMGNKIAFFKFDPKKDKKSVTLEGADSTTFAVYGRGQFAKDKSHIYCDGSKLEGADPNSFSILDIDSEYADHYWLIAKDTQSIYLNCNKVTEYTIEPSALVLFATTTMGAWFRDNEYVYYVTFADSTYTLKLLENFNATGFSIIKGAQEAEYISDGKKIYFAASDGEQLIYIPAEGTDNATFEALRAANEVMDESGSRGGITYARDKNFLYIYDTVTQKLGTVTGIDPKAFYAYLRAGETVTSYFRDNEKVYFVYRKNKEVTFQPVEGADPNTFVVDKGYATAHDSKHSYRYNTIVK